VNAFWLSEAAAFALAVVRVAGLVIVSPFPGKNVPTKAKIALVVLLAFLARANAAPSSFQADFSLFAYVPAELALGIVIGFTVRVTFATAEILGASFAQSIGMTMGQVYDAALGSEDTIPSRIVTLLAMMLFLALGAHRVALGYLLESFRAVPIGHVPDLTGSFASFVTWTDAAMEAGVRLSMPVIAVGLTIQVALALVARASPSLQIFSIGMGVTVAAGLLAILGSFRDTAAGLGAELAQVGPRIEHVLGTGAR